MRKLRSSTRGATELHLLDAHPTAYGLKINKTSQQNKISKTLSITETMFFHVFLSHLYFLIAIVQNANMASR
jgi:hypothetical protein